MAYNTGNALGSNDVRDLSDNAKNLDWFANGPAASYPDRFGTARKSVAQMNAEFLSAQVARANEFIATQNAKQAAFDAAQLARANEYAADKSTRDTEFDADQAERVVEFNQFLESSGFEIPVDYVAGLGITRPTQVVRFSGELYRAHDANLPFTTTTWAADAAKFFSMGDASLRQELATAGVGPALIRLPNGAFVADAIKHVVPTAMTSAAVLTAITYAAAHGLSVEVPDGTYTGADIVATAPVSMVLRPNAFLDFSLLISGNNAMSSNPVTLTGAFAAFPVGTTTFSGNFSAYSPGDVVMIELAGAGSPSFNQAGIDFAIVQTASSTQLVLTTGTRLAYENPVISKLSNAAHYGGSFPVDTIAIAGNYTSLFAQGDILRIENVNGTGGVEGSAFYFEYAKVSAIDNSQITLETRTTHPYTNPWLVKVDAVKGVKLSGGGRIKRLTVSNADGMVITGVIVDRAVYTKVYRYQVIGDIRRGVQEPSTSNATFLFGGSMSDIYCGGSVSSTDNAAFKVLGCPNMQLTNISGGNTKATAQGNYGVFIDFFFTPYRIWNQNLQAENIRGETPNGGSDRSVWMTGIRNGDLEITGGHVFLQSMVDSRADVRCATKQLEIANVVRSTINGDCKLVTWAGGEDSSLNVTVRDTGGINFGRNAWANAGSVHPETGAAYTIGTNNEFNVKNSSANASDVTLYIQSQDLPMVGAGCRDKAGLAASVTLGSLVTNPRMAPNFLQNSLPASSSWASARVKGYLHLDGGFQDGLLRMGTNYLWPDASGKLRIHTAKPSADANGVVVGTQT